MVSQSPDFRTFSHEVYGEEAFLAHVRAAIWFDEPIELPATSESGPLIAFGWAGEPKPKYARFALLPDEVVERVKQQRGRVVFARENLPRRMLDQFENELNWRLLLDGQLNGEFFPLDEEIPPMALGWKPSSAIFARAGLSPGDSGEYLLLIPIDDRWYVLSDRGVRTYSFGQWLGDGETLRFVRYDGGTPRVLRTTLKGTIPQQQVAQQFGEAAAARARADAESIVLSIEHDSDD